MKFSHKKFITREPKGFSVVELLVSVLIFSVLIGALSSIFFSAVKVQRYILATQQLLDQTSYIMEYSSRQLRMAKKITVSSPVCFLTGYNYWVSGPRIDYKSMNNTCKAFSLNGSTLEDQEVGRTDEWLPVTSPIINVKTFRPTLVGDSVGNQPRVTLFLEMESGVYSPRPQIQIQTTISQRDINI